MIELHTEDTTDISYFTLRSLKDDEEVRTSCTEVDRPVSIRTRGWTPRVPYNLLVEYSSRDVGLLNKMKVFTMLENYLLSKIVPP